MEGLGLSPYDLLVGAQILKQVYTACFGLHESACSTLTDVTYSTVPGTLTRNLRARPITEPAERAHKKRVLN